MKKPLILGVLNHKGGVGKTTTAVALADILAQQSNRVLLIDADEQSNVKSIFGVKLKESEGGLAAVLTEDIRPESVCVQVRDKLDVILSGGRKMNTFEAAVPQVDAMYLKMRHAFRELAGRYDYIVVDCPPALSRVVSNVLFFADYILIPSAPDMLSLVGVKSTVVYMDALARDVARQNPDSAFSMAQVLGVVQTMHDNRRNLDTDTLHDLERMAAAELLNGGIVFEPVRSDIKVKTAQVKRKLLSEHCPHSNAYEDYKNLVAKILEHTNPEPLLSPTRQAQPQVTL